MVKFLVQRPIAVLMAFTACFIVGMVTYFTLPVSPGDYSTNLGTEYFCA